MTLISPIATSSYDSDTSTWSLDEIDEYSCGYATTWLVQRGDYSGRVFFTQNGRIDIWYDIATTTISDSVTYYTGKRFRVSLNLKMGGSLSTDVVSDRYRMYYEDVEDDYVTVRWEINYYVSEYVNYYVEVTVYKDGTFLINTSDDKPSSSITVYNSYDVGVGTSVNGDTQSLTFSGRRSFVLLPPTSSDFGWEGDLNTNYSLSDLRYPVTYAVVQNRINRNSSPKKQILPRVYHLCTSLDKAPSGNLKKINVGNIKGSNYFLYGSDSKSYDTDNLKFHIGGKTYSVYNGTVREKTVVNLNQCPERSDITRLYTSSTSYYWEGGLSIGFIGGVTVNKIIVGFETSSNSDNDDYTRVIPNSSYPKIYLLYNTSAPSSSSYIGYGRTDWSRLVQTIQPLDDGSSLYGCSGSLVFDFGSPTTIYELAIEGHTPSSSSTHYSIFYPDSFVLL